MSAVWLFFGADFILSEFTDNSFEVKAILCFDFYAFGDVFRRCRRFEQPYNQCNRFECKRLFPNISTYLHHFCPPKKGEWSLKRLRFMHRRCASWHAVPLHTFVCLTRPRRARHKVLHWNAFSDKTLFRFTPQYEALRSCSVWPVIHSTSCDGWCKKIKNESFPFANIPYRCYFIY